MKMSKIMRIWMVLVAVLLSLGMINSVNAASVSGPSSQQKKSTPASPASPGQGSPSIAPPPSSTVGGAGGMNKEVIKEVGRITVETSTWEFGNAKIKAKLVDLNGMPMKNKYICEGSFNINICNMSLATAAFWSPTTQACGQADQNGYTFIDLEKVRYPNEYHNSYPWTPGTHNVNVFHPDCSAKGYARGSGQIVITKAKTFIDVSRLTTERREVPGLANSQTVQICGIRLVATATRQNVTSPNSTQLGFVEINWSPRMSADPGGATPLKQSAKGDNCFTLTLPARASSGQPQQWHFTVKYTGSALYLPSEIMFNLSETAFAK